jgi:hypothetical protein
MKYLNLSSKAKTLEDLKNVLKNAEVLPLVRFYAVEYKEKKEQILKQIKSVFKTNLIVRSSSSNEDNLQTSNAGGFDSVLNVDINSIDDIDSEISQVINSYQDGLNEDDEVFIQPMLQDVTMSGFIFTCDIDTLAP